MIFKETEKIFSRIPVGAKGLKKRQKLRMIKEKKNEVKQVYEINSCFGFSPKKRTAAPYYS